MSDSHQLSQIVVVLGTGLVVAWLFRVVRVPTIIGFLITGIAIGPSAGRLIPPEQVSQFAELGLILLLFTVGLELSPEPLLRSGKGLLIATGAQIAVTMVVTALVLSFCSSLGLMSKAVIGLAVALSSTAIVLKQMSDRGETTSTTGLITTGILLLQDVIVIVVLLVASIASTKSGGNWRAAAAQSVGGLAGLTIIVIAARRLLPIVLMQIVRHGGRELITLFAVLMACGGAWLAALAGWSPALGACISGLLLAGADQRHQLVAEITPFRDVFNALFFISLGMSVQLSTAFAHLPILVTAILATLALKSVITAIAVRVAGWPSRLGLHVGFGLCTVSEFSYVLALQAHGMNLLPAEALDMMVVYAVGTMMLGALLYPLAAPVAVFAANRLLAGAVDAEPDPSHGGHAPFDNHVVVVGYGITGSNLCRMLKATHVPHCVVEMNQSLVQNARDAEEAVIVGDATRMSILDHAGIAKARVLVVAINDKQATQRIVGQVSARRPELYILARTGFATDIEALYQRGATLVIPADFETSIEVAAHVLKKFGVPDNIIEAQVNVVRTGGYAMLRGTPTTRAAQTELMKILERTTIQTFYLAEGSTPCGLTIGELNLRATTGCTIIAAVRSGNPTTNPSPDFRLQANDVLVLVGAHPQIEAAKVLLQHKD